MKIEKINDNQIRCTLTREDLENHQIRLSELAYGTEKAKNLFRDMMMQAQKEFGFVADNIPLMIEAIPMTSDSIVLIVTKVEDPEELDTRFSKFSPGKDNDEAPLHFDGADNIIDIFHKLYESKGKAAVSKQAPLEKPAEGSAPGANVPFDLVHQYSFLKLDDVIRAGKGLNGFYTGINSLYKDARAGTYLLVVHQSAYTPEEFNKVCNILSEYGKGRTFSHASEAYLLEHGDILIARKALQNLSKL